jgi:hypothetical protein
MSSDDRACPLGSEWTETAVRAGDLWKRQWTHPNGAIRRDYGEYTESVTPSGDRQFSGRNGSHLTISPNGVVEVRWNGLASIAADHAKGNRKHRPTKTTGKGKAVQRDESFSFISGIRESFIFSKGSQARGNVVIKWDQKPQLPTDPNSPEAQEILTAFHSEAWHMLAAIISGNADELDRIAAAVKYHETIRREYRRAPNDVFATVVKAIRAAAIKAEGVPSRPAILEEYGSLGGGGSEGITMESFREMLGRMGFGWLHAGIGKRGKKRVG